MYTSPVSYTYLTGGLWSPTRPAVVVLSTLDGSLLVWDFTDSSARPSSDLKAMHTRVSSMEFLKSASSSQAQRQQLLAVGDETGTLHIFEMPRNVAKPVHREETAMRKFLDREIKVRGTLVLPRPFLLIMKLIFLASDCNSTSRISRTWRPRMTPRGLWRVTCTEEEELEGEELRRPRLVEAPARALRRGLEAVGRETGQRRTTRRETTPRH